MERKIVEQLLCKKKVNEICRELRISKRRLMMVRAKACEAGYLDGKPLPPFPESLFEETDDQRSKKSSPHWNALEEHKDWIKERLVSGWHAVTVYEELPVSVPRSSFYRFLTRHKLNERRNALRRVIPEIVHLPGEALLIDWGFLWNIDVDGKKVKLWAFAGILGYSRQMVVCLMTRLDQQSTLKALEQMYRSIGGVPKRTTSDNPKVFTIKADKYEPIVHPIYERFASHYGTIIECLAPSDPQKKGKIERPIPYIRRLLEGYSGDRNDVEALQEYLDKKIVLANERKHGTTGERPLDRFLLEEKERLQTLPILSYEVEQYHEGIVRIDGHVRFDGKYYSVSEELIRKTVTIIANSRQVSIYHNGALIEVHERLIDKTRSKATKRHHLKPWEQIRDNKEGLRSLAQKIGPSVEAVVHHILVRGDGFVDLRKIWGILSFTKKYEPSDINDACTYALTNGCVSYQDIRRLLEENQATALNDSKPLPKGRFERDISEYSEQLLTLHIKGDIHEH